MREHSLIQKLLTDLAPSLGNTQLSKVSVTSSSVTIRWTVPDLPPDGHNKVIYSTEMKTGTGQFQERNDLEVRHSDVTGGQAEVTIDGLARETLYVIQVVPYAVDLLTSKKQRGVPSRELEAYTWDCKCSGPYMPNK